MIEITTEARPEQYPPFHVSRQALSSGRVLVRAYDGDGYLDKRYIEYPAEQRVKVGVRDNVIKPNPIALDQAQEVVLPGTSIGLQDGTREDLVVNP